jgi:hypothetical protein
VRLFTNHTLGSIVRKLKERREKGKIQNTLSGFEAAGVTVCRRGVRASFVVTREPRTPVYWFAKIGSVTHEGQAGTVWEAAAQIEKLEGR